MGQENEAVLAQVSFMGRLACKCTCNLEGWQGRYLLLRLRLWLTGSVHSEAIRFFCGRLFRRGGCLG